MSFRTPRQDSVLVATGVRKSLVNAIESLDILIEDTDGSIDQAERNALKGASLLAQQALQNLNQGAPDLTGLTGL